MRDSVSFAIGLLMFCAWDTASSAIEAPVLISPTNGEKNVLTSVTLKWKSVSGAASYHLQVSETPDFTEVIFDRAGLTDTSQTITSGLSPSLITIGKPVNYGNQGGFFNDNPRTMIRKGSTATFRSFEGFNDVIYEGTLTNPVATSRGNYSWDWNGDNTHELSWIMAAHNPGGDTLLGYVHTEDFGQTRFTVGLALSTNFGNSWTYIGDVASHDSRRNLGGGMMIMMNGYIYMYYNGNGINVCRSPIDSVMIAARQKKVTKWMTYSNGGWTLPALTDTLRQGTRTFPGDAHGGATVVKSTGTVLGLPNSGIGTSTTPIHASTDGLTVYQTFNINAPGSVYGSFAGSAESGTRTDHFEVGDHFYIYWDHKSNNNYNDDHFYYAEAGVTPKHYYWRVRTNNQSGTGPWSAVHSFTTRATIQSGQVVRVNDASALRQPQARPTPKAFVKLGQKEALICFAQTSGLRKSDVRGRVITSSEASRCPDLFIAKRLDTTSK